MYRSRKTILTEEQSCKYELFRQEDRLPYIEFISLLQRDEGFRSFFIDLLSSIPYHAYQCETPPVTSDTADRPFEFVIHNSPGIDLPPDPGPFLRYFDADKQTAVFDNLGNDARLIAPVPSRPQRNYSHIGVFTEEAPMIQQQALWQTAGRVTDQLISDRPLWLNTAGGGVAWLHVRLDSRPKYYRHRPYMTID